MSWSLSFNTDGAHFYADLGAIEGGQVGYAENESKDQVEAAKGAVATLIGSGAIGNDAKGFSVSINGHANPSHEPAEGWTNDTITITVTQSKDLVPADAIHVVEETQTEDVVIPEPVPAEPVVVDPAPAPEVPPAA